MELRATEVRPDVFARDVHRRAQLTGFDLRRDFAQQPSELALEVAHAGFAGVVGDDPAQRLLADRDFIGAETVALELPLQQMIASDGQLLFLGVAVEPDDFHPVQQRSRNGVGHVGRWDEQDF